MSAEKDPGVATPPARISVPDVPVAPEEGDKAVVTSPKPLSPLERLLARKRVEDASEGRVSKALGW